MSDDVDLSPAALAKAKQIAERAWDWPPKNRDAAADLAQKLIPVLVDRVTGFTWADVDVLGEAINEFKVKGIAPVDPRSDEFREVAAALQSVADRIATLLPPRR